MNHPSRGRLSLSRVPALILALLVLLLAGVGAVLAFRSDANDGSRTASMTGPGHPKAFPTGTTAGLRENTRLQPYAGPCSVADGSEVTITRRDVAAHCSALTAYRGSFTITDSRLPRLEAQWPGAIAVTNSDVLGGDQSQFSAAVSYNEQSPTTGFNLVIKGTEIRGGKDSVECRGNCFIEDSYLHDQRSYEGAHIQGFLTSGGNNMVLRHNSIACDPPSEAQGEGCTADVALFGDLAQVNNVLVEKNLLLGGPYPAFCIYGGYQPGKAYPISTNIRIVDNVFERGPYRTCGRYGPTSSVEQGTGGSIWSRNTWTDGGTVAPES